MVPTSPVYYFWAPWCTFCKEYGPVAKEAIKDSGLDIVTVNVDEESDIAYPMGVKSLPTLAFEGKLLVGYRTRNEVDDWLLSL